MGDPQTPKSGEAAQREQHAYVSARDVHTLIEDGQLEPESEQLTAPVWSPIRLLQGLGALLILAVAVFVTVTTLSRVAGNGVLGAVEIGALSMVFLTALSIPAVTAADENFRLEIIDHFTGPRTQRMLELIGLVLQLVIGAVVTVFMVSLFINDITTLTTTAGELGISRYWVSGAAVVGFAGVVYAVLVRLLRFFKTADTDKES